MKQPTKLHAAEQDDPRRTFEKAVSQLQRNELLSLSQRPICPRRHTVPSDFSEKQSLKDAAHALARLWNVSVVRDPLTIRTRR